MAQGGVHLTHPAQGVRQRNGVIESRNHARKSVASIWLSRPQRRFRCAALLSPAEDLLASAVVLPLHCAGHEATGISTGLAWLFGSRPPVLEAILDTLRVEGRSRASCLRAGPAACSPDGRACSAHGRDEVRALDGQRFPTAPALG